MNNKLLTIISILGILALSFHKSLTVKSSSLVPQESSVAAAQSAAEDSVGMTINRYLEAVKQNDTAAIERFACVAPLPVGHTLVEGVQSWQLKGRQLKYTSSGPAPITRFVDMSVELDVEALGVKMNSNRDFLVWATEDFIPYHRALYLQQEPASLLDAGGLQKNSYSPETYCISDVGEPEN